MLREVVQRDFSGGIWRDPDAPANAVNDAVNALVGDQDTPSLEKRGGTSYVTTSDAGETLLGIAAMHLPTVGDVTLAWGATKLFRVSGTTFVDLLAGSIPKALVRWAAVGSYWLTPSAGMSNAVTEFDGTTVFAGTIYGSVTSISAIAACGTVPRLLIGDGTKVWFSEPGDHTTVSSTSYHEMPNRTQVVGLDAIGDTAIVFTTNGIYTISNMDYDPVDDNGNIQHSVALATKDVILWGDAGVAAFGSALVVPAIDDVVIFAPGAPATAISKGIRGLYRSYVKAGYKPGLAYVHRGHYVLPVVNSSNVLVDTFVCRLDRGTPAWTRWSGHAGCIAYATKVGSSSARSPKLYGISGQRVIDLSDCFVPAAANKNDADGTPPEFNVILERRVTPGTRPVTVKTARIRYQLTDDATDNPTLIANASVDAGTTLATLTGSAPGTTNEANYTWGVARAAVRVKLQLTSSGASSALKLHEVTFRVRVSGKR